ncbi:CU044_5270 family protein [Actinoplanes rectilineatus]|uniref:CU044_5270 family protein n=1 Tax=Actinoplanes rectilineatus TaxID=113571 RepID=UPI0005F283C4|nr:CU044_5270 family protein [Actinoplanes rectilineatus]
MNEIDVLHDAFGPDEAPSAAAQDRARAALLDRISGPAPVRRRPRWALRITAAVVSAAAATVGVVALENAGPVTLEGVDRPIVAALPFAQPASAAQVLENAAWTASRRPWVTPRPEQFAYVETIATQNVRSVLDASPNGPLVDGKTEVVRKEVWNRVDGDVVANRTDGEKLTSITRSKEQFWFTVPYGDLAALTTPEKFQAWLDDPDKLVGIDVDGLLTREVLPPDVEAAIFRWLARQPGVTENPKAVNLDGRPAIALTWTVEGYLKKDLLFDPRTYALIGDRMVAVKDHVSRGDDGTRRIKAGDVFRLVVRNRSGIVDRPGDTPAN